MKKNALITGGTGAIGRSIVETLSKRFNLILVSRNEKKLKEIASNYESVINYYCCDSHSRLIIQ